MALALAHGDENVTVCAEVTGTPPLLTVTVTLVVPNAESGVTPTPKTGVLMETLATPTENPVDPVTVDVPTNAFAVMVVAPATDPPARVMVATPAASVSAVPDDGVMVAMLESANVNVTTVLATATPLASVNVAFALAVAPLETEVTAAPVTGSVKLIDNPGAATIVVVEGVPPVVVVVEAVPPSPQAASNASIAANMNIAGNLKKYLVKLKFRTQCSRSRDSRI